MAPPNEARTVRGVRLSPDEAAAADYATAAIAGRLPRIRKSATTWGTTWAAVFTLLGAAEVFGATATVRTLQGDWDIWYTVVTVLGLGLAAGATLVATWAAAASPTHIDTDIESALRLEQDLFSKARTKLKVAHLLGALAALLIAASFFFLWLSPAVPPKVEDSGASSGQQSLQALQRIAVVESRGSVLVTSGEKLTRVDFS